MTARRGRAPIAAAPVLAVALVLPALRAPGARELWSHGDMALELSGSVRELVQLGEQTDRDAFESAFVADPSCLSAATFTSCSAFAELNDKDAWQSLTRVRTRLDFTATPELRAVVVYDHELQTGILDTFEADLARSYQRENLLDLDSQILREDDVAWRHLLYRGYVQYRTEKVDVIVGRQRVAWGVGRLWNPIDRFNAIPPLAVQADQSQGIDSVDARWSFDGFNFAEAVYAPGSDRNEARYALRLHGVVLDSDVSLMGGRFEKAPTIGVDFARNLADAAVRVEAVWTDPHDRVWPVGSPKPVRVDDFWQVVASIDYNWEIAGDGVYLLAEHLYNGNALGFGRGRPGPLLPLFQTVVLPPPGGTVAAPGSTAMFGTSRVVTNAEQQTAVLVGRDLSPELRLEFLSIYDWNGESAAFFPLLRYSPTGSLDVTLGVQTFVGPHRSQFGDAGTFVYALADFYF